MPAWDRLYFNGIPGGTRTFSGLHGIEFDAFATYANHGCALTLIRFTESWENPFDTTDMMVRNPKICKEVEHTISSIRSLQKRDKNDTETQARLRDELKNSDIQIKSYDYILDAFLK